MLAVTELISFGVLYYAFSALLVPMRAELGWSVGVLSGGFSVALLASGLVAPFAGRWLDRHGGRVLMTAGSVLGTLAVVAWSRVETVAGYYGAWLAIGVAMAAVLYEPAFAVVTAWFVRQRVRAMLILTVTGGLASTIFLPLTNALAGAVGWRDALLALAAILGVGTILPHLLVLRRRPADLGLMIDGERRSISPAPGAPGWPDPDRVPEHEPEGLEASVAMRVPAWWWLVAAFVLSTFTTTAVTVYLLAFLIAEGHPGRFAALVAGAFGLFTIAGRVAVTGAGRVVSQGRLNVTLFGLQGLAVVVLVAFGGGRVGVLVFIALFGASAGALTLTRATLVADYFGRRAYGAISGTLALFTTLARAAAPVGVGLAVGAAGGYRLVFVGLVVAAGLSTGAMAMAERRRPPSIAIAPALVDGTSVSRPVA